jgi:hypothetical protein
LGTVSNVSSSHRAERISLAVPPLDAQARERAAEQDWEPNLLDPDDPDERGILIRLAHPNLDEAIEAGLEEVVIGGEPMNPRPHLAIHEVVATQVIDDDPPEAFATLQRLMRLGRDPHEALHMLGYAVSAQLWAATHEGRPYDRDEHIRALDSLPGSWDDLAVSSAGPRHATGARGRPRRRRGRR